VTPFSILITGSEEDPERIVGLVILPTDAVDGRNPKFS